ncbi:hypothetical protein C7451_10249 [Blastomonas natatoria]|uniref:DUF2239 family protein n=1 Tax=Blastomonas natatoria TaxID=34015 RepID=A0A2V3VPA7_9SPHN|nr:DUF2239 family protein [Blastomonas natatoria]PXW78379.1 hypothetical protein C7451_10249 [Blastomonas natatoria]
MTNVTAFQHGRQIASGPRDEVARVLAEVLEAQDGTILVFDDCTGRVTDLDYRNVAPRAAGRPKLGVQAREVTLLPKHWDWLANQSGGASATLRRLIDQERAKGRTDRECRDAAYRFMQAACGDMPNYEEALRALYSARTDEFQTLTSAWPGDMVRFMDRLLGEQVLVA